MNPEHAPGRPGPGPERSKRGALRARLTVVVHALWAVLAVLALGLFVISIPPYLSRELHSLADAERAALAQLGLPADFRAVYSTALGVVTALVFSLVAGGVLWRASADWVARLVSVALLTLGVAISPSLDTLVGVHSFWSLPVLIVRGLGIGSTLAVFYVFPDGRFTPRWMRLLVFIWIGWALAWLLIPTTPVDFDELPFLLRLLASFLLIDSNLVTGFYRYLRVSSLLLVTAVWFGTGVFAQIYRYTRVSSPEQRQQSKWVVFGLTAAVVGYFGFRLALLVIPPLRTPGLARLLFFLIGEPFSVLLLLLAPLSIGISILKYRLWDIDPIIHRTLVYAALTGALGAVYFGGVVLFQQVFRAVTGYQSTLAIAVSTLVIAALVRPLRSRLQVFIDRRFYRERVDFRRAFTHFLREVRTIVDLPELLRALVDRTMRLLHIAHGAVFLREPDGAFLLAEGRALPAGEPGRLALETQTLGRLWSGLAVSQPKDPLFPLLVPLTAPRSEGAGATDLRPHLLGVLALGPRLSGQRYSREDQALLTGLADQAGTAVYVAQVFQEKQQESQRRAEVERRLEAYRDSPAGRAEAFARKLLSAPETALVVLNDLALAAGQDLDAARVMENLHTALENLGAQPVADLAEGYNYLLAGQFAPELVPVGLRALIVRLESGAIDGLQHADEALAVYRLCQAALDASSVAHIAQFLPRLRELEAGSVELVHCLARVLTEFRAAAEALHACERLDTSQDKLAYVACAVERLLHADHLTQTELGGADRAVAQRIAASWLAIVTGAMSELQARAQIVCRLLTRHTWHEDVVSLVLSLRNDGHGAALNVRVALTPTPEYTLVDDVAVVERLTPGEEARVELRVRPHMGLSGDQFRAQFVILYTDPRGPDQVENFADVVRLLAPEGEFHFVPNPYVVGTPLQPGSPLFFGRQDLLVSIEENLAAGHRNNLVLIGQRRTGKTSLLKQLPARLGEEYLAVYLDGQTLGLDPGLPSFFLTLATEIAFALEDHGFSVGQPELSDFTESPAATFEYHFLSGVREAIGDRHLLFTFDEFEELESAVRRGNLDESVFGFLRHLIQHSLALSVIFCGTHRLEELAADYWSVLFNISLYQQVGFLKQPEAMCLIQEPVAQYGMRYDDLSLDKMWRVTAGHPYFLQLLCHSLVNRHNRVQRSYVTVADLNAALEDILASGEAHFVYLWTEATPYERLVLTALSRMVPLTGRATPVQIVDYFAERGVTVERRAVGEALHRLALRDILETSGEGDVAVGEAYRWKLGLLGLWAQKYKSLSRVVDEVLA
jgi:GAF domain-containing protein